MGTHMKTTIDIADELLAKAKQIAERDSTTLKSLAEDGLRKVIAERERAQRPRKIKAIVFKGGKGLTPQARSLSWSQIREMANERE